MHGIFREETAITTLTLLVIIGLAATALMLVTGVGTMGMA